MDILFENHGTIWLVRHQTDVGRAWLHKHVDFQQWMGHAGIVDPEYAQPIVEAAQRAGMVIEVVRGEA